LIAACGGVTADESVPGACSLTDALREPGRLTVATSGAGRAPWVLDDDPAGGRGFEAALVYSIADELGIDSVVWTETDRENALAPGGKDFDLAIQQLTIPEVEAPVDFSVSYYQVEQVIVSEPDGPIAGIQRLADLGKLRLGVIDGTNGIDYVATEIAPATPPVVFEDAAAAAAGLAADEIDGILLGLPAAFAMIADAGADAAILFVLPRVDEAPAELAMAFAEASPLLPCINDAIEALRDEGILAELEVEWLHRQGRIPSLSP
jgi:polar amino acid transport system substrate-binding protein